MIKRFNIVSYCRISVDNELDRDNVSVKGQKAIIENFIKSKFSCNTLTLFEDWDHLGFTFDLWEGYQSTRKRLMSHKHDIAIVKDVSHFSWRNSLGLVELEGLRDLRSQIISIRDNINFPIDDWLKSSSSLMRCRSPTPAKIRSMVHRR